MIATDFFCKGLLIGLSVAIAIGPIALLCIQRTLSRGFKIGFLTGLGAAAADGLYGLIAGAGLAAIANFFITYEGYISGIGSIFLFWLGFRTFYSVPVEVTTATTRDTSLLHSFASSFFLTLASPMTILMFTAIFASLGLVGTASGYSDATSLVCGVFLGSTVWWLILSGLIGIIRDKLSQKVIVRINQTSGIFLFGFATYAITRACGSL